MMIHIEENGQTWTVDPAVFADRAKACQRSVRHAPDQSIPLLTTWERRPAPIDQVVIYWLRQMHWDDVGAEIGGKPIIDLRNAAYSVIG